MDNFITIPKILAQEVANIAENNGGIMLMAEGECSCDGNCTGECKGGCTGSCKGGCSGGCQKVCQKGNQTIGSIISKNKEKFSYFKYCEIGEQGSVKYVDNTDKTSPFKPTEFIKDITIQNVISAEKWNKWIKNINSYKEVYETSPITPNNVSVKPNDIISSDNVDPLVKQIYEANSETYGTVKNQLITTQFFKDLIDKYNDIKYDRHYEDCWEACEPTIVGQQPKFCESQKEVDNSPICYMGLN